MVVGSWLSTLDNQHGFTAVTVLDTLGWLAAVVAGLALQANDARPGSGAAPATSSWPQANQAR
ncbi:hypothetical protein AB0M46_43990 [Dactylosporangium sp. NPDC051485]|uniref:hypothetical protein n=1 Tax=Dactylosporangium sp. NPDC051485 TaxID=3154846 RepID=UPI00341A4C91